MKLLEQEHNMVAELRSMFAELSSMKLLEQVHNMIAEQRNTK